MTMVHGWCKDVQGIGSPLRVPSKGVLRGGGAI